MSLFESFRNEAFAAMPDGSDARTHPIVFRRVFRFVAAELPAYQADLENMTTDQAKQQLCERVEARYRKAFRVDGKQPSGDGPYGFIVTVAVILGAIVLAAVEWAVWKILDIWWDKHRIQQLAMEAEQPEPEPAD